MKRTDPSNRNANPRRRNRERQHSECQRRRLVGSDGHRHGGWKRLLSHIAPVGVLMLGMLWLMTTATEVAGQQNATGNYGQPGNYAQPTYSGAGNFGGYGQTQYPATQQEQFRQNQSTAAAAGPQARVATTATSSIPSLETQTEVDPAGESGTTSWQMPAILSKISEGGVLMIPLAICSLVVLALSLERLISLRRARVIPRPFVRRFTECVEDGQLSFDEATELCEEFSCPVAEVFQAAVKRWGRPMFEVEQAVMDAGDRVADGLKRFLRVFHAISNVAPLIGLLGTVLGMIDAFEMISSEESIGRPESLAAGISMALLTTAGGLSVAIPAYLAYMYFSAKSDAYLNEIDRLCQRVVDCISAEGLENTGGKSRKRRAA